ncbi:MAG: MerR family transcriptional regulator [Solirubrobacterales bacterium]
MVVSMMLKIGQVASLAGVGVDTVRYYERVGLLAPVSRRSSGYRVFNESSVERIRLVKRLQELGVTLDEISAMLRAVGDRDGDCAGESEKIRAALARTETQIAGLEVVRARQRGALRRCASGDCRIVEDIARSHRASCGAR